jgi:hypothetical protein
MKLKGFLFLFAVTVATIMFAGTLANYLIAEKGLMRTLLVAAIAIVVVYPAAMWAEKKGWVSGSLDLRKKKPVANPDQGDKKE